MWPDQTFVDSPHTQPEPIPGGFAQSPGAGQGFRIEIHVGMVAADIAHFCHREIVRRGRSAGKPQCPSNLTIPGGARSYAAHFLDI